jgi:ribose transport system substrate-binding protein
MKQNEKNGYSTVSMNTTPGIGGAAFWLSYKIARGAEVPQELVMPVATVTQENLKEFADIKPGIIVSPSYSEQWVEQNLVKK